MVEHGSSPPSFDRADPPDTVYENNPHGIGEYPAGDVPGERSLPSSVLLTTREIFKKELRSPAVRSLVDSLHEQDFVVVAERAASRIIFKVAKNKTALGLTAGTIGAAFAVHRSRKRSSK